MSDSTKCTAVGFDLGTTMSAAAYVDRLGQPVIVPGPGGHADGVGDPWNELTRAWNMSRGMQRLEPASPTF